MYLRWIFTSAGRMSCTKSGCFLDRPSVDFSGTGRSCGAPRLQMERPDTLNRISYDVQRALLRAGVIHLAGNQGTFHLLNGFRDLDVTWAGIGAVEHRAAAPDP